MNCYPWMKFEPTAWFLDTRVLGAEARALWIDVICFMWQSDNFTGKYTQKISRLARLVGFTEAQVRAAAKELQECEICYVAWANTEFNPDDVPADVPADVPDDVPDDVPADVPQYIAFYSRRLMREAKERENERVKKQKQRSSKYENKNTSPVNVPELSPVCPPTEEKRREEKRRDKKEECASHTARAHEGEPSGLVAIAERICEARDDWALKVEAVAKLLRDVPGPYQAAAVESFIGDTANMVESPRNPLSLLRKYLQNADFHEGKKSAAQEPEELDHRRRRFQQG